MNRTLTITVDDLRMITLTVGDLLSNNIDILGYSQGDILTLTFVWTSAPVGTSITGATFEARYNRGDAFGSGPLNISGTVTVDGSSGTASVVFVIPLAALTPHRGYYDIIILTDSVGNTKEWSGVIRPLP